MVRTVVYPNTILERDLTNNVAVAEVSQEDSYADKLVKYIPAEVIGFFIPAYALATQVSGHWAQWLVLGLCALGTVGYLMIKAPKDAPPRWYFYILALLSFLAWAIGTSDALTNLLQTGNDENTKLVGKLILAAAVFLIPLIDSLLTRFLPPAPAPAQAFAG
ncbi:MAG: hypothetical protein ABIS20_24035 [Thermoanaerobaculia bacterium]